MRSNRNLNTVSKSKVSSLLICDTQCYLYGICCDSKGITYFTDTKNHRILKYDPSTRVATVLSGGTKGFEDGPSHVAKFDSPNGICLDNEGNLLVTDQNNFRIRQIRLKDGSVSTLAGTEEGFLDGQAASCQFSSCLSGICVDPSGGIFVADTRNDRVRLLKGGVVSTVYGNGKRGSLEGQLNRPYGVCCDKSGQFLFIADFERIRKMDRSSKVLTTLASFRGSIPFGICLDSCNNVVVTDKASPTIRLIKENGEVIDLAGLVEGNEDGPLSSAKFKDPRGVCINQLGDIIVIDNGNYRVRSIVYDCKNLQSVEMGPLMKSEGDKDKEIELLKLQLAEKDQEIGRIRRELVALQRGNLLSDLNRRQILSIHESINFMSSLKIQEVFDPLQEQLKKLYPLFPLLDIIVSDVNTWYEGWKYGPNPDNLSEEEVKAIRIYTHEVGLVEKKDNFYYILNEILRNRSCDDFILIRGYLSHLLNAIKKLKDVQTIIYRGIPNLHQENVRIEQEYVLDRPIHWSSFSSGTTNLKTAKDFAKEGGIIFVIKVHSGKSISSYSMLPREEEILLHPNMKFKVIEAIHHNKEDNFYYLTLEEEKSPVIY